MLRLMDFSLEDAASSLKALLTILILEDQPVTEMIKSTFKEELECHAGCDLPVFLETEEWANNLTGGKHTTTAFTLSTLPP